jgi:uracil-DNA glycosylase family protein
VGSLERLRSEAAGCTRCDLYQRATQTVFGEGPAPADVMMVGEQPGDQEDRQGRPFVGPAGRVLDEALVAAGIHRDRVYVTNVVKHFKWTPRGKRRIHGTPNQTEIVACRPWLEGELDAVQPQLVVALGATAAKALHGMSFRVTKQRGEVLPITIGSWSGVAVATVHPSSILRAPDEAARDEAMAAFIQDLEVVSAHLAEGGA